MKSLFILSALLLAGCASKVPVAPKWPEVPAELRVGCDKLKPIPENTVSITEMMKVIVENYTLHYQCSMKADSWNKWYDDQKRIYETVVPE